MLQLLASITEQSYLGESSDKCKIYTKWEVFKYNYLVWCVGFLLLGCQFTHADVGPMTHFALSWDSMQNWGAFLWGIFVALIVFVAALLYNLALAYKSCDILEYYIVWVLLLAAFIIWNTKR